MSVSKKIAVIGCGYWGKNLIRNFAELGCLEYVSDENHDLAQKYADDLSIKALSFEEVLESNVDGVVLATPAQIHFSMGAKVLESNKHLFIEKPLTIHFDEANKLVRSSTEKGLTLMVGHLMLHHPAFLKVKSFCKQGKIGQIKHISSRRLTFGKIRSYENVLWSFAPHDLSMIHALIESELENVSSSSAVVDSSSSNFDYVHSVLSFKNGASASLDCSWVSPFKEQRITIIGTNGAMVFDDTLPWNQKLSIYYHDNFKEAWDQNKKTNYEPEYIHVSEDEPLRLECQNFIDSIDDISLCKSSGLSGELVVSSLSLISDSLK